MANNPTLKGVGSPLNYVGTNSPQPPNLIAKNVSPTSGTKNVDIRNFSLGDLWLNSSTNVPYMLTNMDAYVPTWTALASSGSGANDFITDSGTATQVGGNLNVFGGDLINTVGAGSTVTVNLNRGTNGQIIVAKTGGASAYAHLTSSGGTITITEGANTLNIDTASGVLIKILDDDGGMATPSAGAITFHDSANIEITASGSGVTTAIAGVIPIANGGTNASSMATTDGVVYYDGTRLVTTSAGTAGQVLTSNGAGVAPTYQSGAATTAFNSIVVQTFTSNGTYTPTANMKYCIVECLGGGGGGAGLDGTSATQVGAAGGGGAGGYCRKVFAAATIGVSQAVTIGALGAGGAAGFNNGSTGGTTTFGALLTANGGVGGNTSHVGDSSGGGGGGGGTASGGDVNITGQIGFVGMAVYVAVSGTGSPTSIAMSGQGGSTMYGSGGGAGVFMSNSGAGGAASGFGAGGSGAGAGISGVARAGGDGVAGLVVVTEFVH